MKRNELSKIMRMEESTVASSTITSKERSKMRYMSKCTREEVLPLLKTTRDVILYAATFKLQTVKGGVTC